MIDSFLNTFCLFKNSFLISLALLSDFLLYFDIGRYLGSDLGVVGFGFRFSSLIILLLVFEVCSSSKGL